MSIAAEKNAKTGKVPAEQVPGAPVLPSGVALEPDDQGYLYDPWFRDLILNRVNRASFLDKQSMLDTEAVRAVAICGKVLHQAFEDGLNQVGVTHQQYRTMMCILSRGEGGTQLHDRRMAGRQPSQRHRPGGRVGGPGTGGADA